MVIADCRVPSVDLRSVLVDTTWQSAAAIGDNLTVGVAGAYKHDEKRGELRRLAAT